MKIGTMITTVLSVIILGGGCVVLSQVMADEQQKSVEKIIKKEENTRSDYQKDIGKNEKALKNEWKKSDGYPIYMDENTNNSVKKEKVDMETGMAVKKAVSKVKEIYGNIEVLEVAGVYLGKPGSYSDDSKDYTYRAYTGLIKTKDNIGYEFVINSITGEVTCLTKVWEFSDPVFWDESNKMADKFYDDIEKNREKYVGIAEEFIAKHMKRGKVKKIFDVLGGGISQAKVPAWNISFYLATVTVSCKTEDGSSYMVDIYPKTGEVVDYTLMNASKW